MISNGARSKGELGEAAAPGLVALFAALGIALTIVTVTPLTAWYSRRLSGPYTESGGQVLVVLGGSFLEPGIVGDDTYWRAVYAVRADRRWHYPRIILSGAEVSQNMRDFLVSMGIPLDVIQFEQQSHSTGECYLHPANAGEPLRADGPDDQRLPHVQSVAGISRAG
jgi:uncharacterized SAM-binding protein YcdF (DUF218 family)